MSPPNVVFVFADQWPAHACGYAGDPNVRTPRIDAFAEESVNVHHAVANTPVCTPCRATLLTGLLPDRHGLFLNDAPLDPGLHTVGKHFRDAGYDTAYIGKWHVDGHGRTAWIPPERQHGFDTWKVLECTHDYNDSRYYAGDDPTPRTWETYDAIAQTDDAVRLLRERDRDRPLFLMMSWGPPHNPYDTAPERFQRLYEPESIELRPNVPADHAAATRAVLAGFYAHCSALDECLGRLLDTLDELGMADNTLIVFTSDHGDHLGAHYLAEKQSPLDESLRIPCLLRWPGTLTPHANGSLFSFLDWYPTLCGLTGVIPPDHLQGRDFSGHFRHGTTPREAENDAFCASYHVFGTWPRQHHRKPVPEHLRAREYRGLRTPRYTYCEDLEGPWLLFDNEEDPHQLANRVNDPECEPIRKHLAQRLRERRHAYADDFHPGMEYVRRWGYQVDESGTMSTR